MTLGDGKVCRVAQASSRKGCMRGKGGPENALCTFKGVRQGTWGKWVAEIREPNGGNRRWLGTFDNSYEAAVAYDAAARKMYGPDAKLNLPHLYEENCQQVMHIQENHFFVAQSAHISAASRHPFEGSFVNNTPKTESISWEEMSSNLRACLPEVDDSAMWAEAAKDTTFQLVEDFKIFSGSCKIE